MRSWADDFNTYEEACHYYGVDTPAQVAAEEEFWAALEREELMDRMMAGAIQPGAVWKLWTDECPF